MTKIKLCGLRTPADIRAANALRPEYIGFVLAPGSRRAVTPVQAAALKARLAPGIRTVGVFVDAPPAEVAALLGNGTLDIAQLHGREDEAYLTRLRALTDKPLWQAVRLTGPGAMQALETARRSTADLVLLDAGAGDGAAFDWGLAGRLGRPYLLAGGLTPGNVAGAIRRLHPFGVDVSSGIETNGVKDAEKMAAFVAAVRKEEAV